MKNTLQRIQNYTLFACVRGIIYILQLIPVELCANIMGWLWRTLAPLNARHKRADAQLARAMPGLSAEQREGILSDVWENLGRVVAESLYLEQLSHRNDILEAPPAAVLKSVKAKGGVIVSMHGGNWELTALPARDAGFNMMGVYQAIQNPYLNAYVHKLRAPFWPAGLLTKGHGTARALLNHVRKGGIIGMLADTREYKGISVPFFGIPAPTNPFPAMVAIREKAPLYATRIIRIDTLRFRSELVEIHYKITGNFDADVFALTTAIQAQFEHWIREYPAQWMWGHKRWG